MFIAYLFTPVPEVIYQYPTPENAGKIIYKDSADVCYTYNANEVECTGDEEETEIQHADHDKPNGKGVFSRLFDMFSRKSQ